MTNKKRKIAIFIGGFDYYGIPNVYFTLVNFLSSHYILDLILVNHPKLYCKVLNNSFNKISYLIPQGNFRWYKPIKVFLSIKRYFNIVKSGNYDLVLSSHYFCNFLAVLFSKSLRYKIILTQHADFMVELRNMRSRFTFSLRKFVAKRCFMLADSIICVSKGVHRDLIKNFNIPPDKCKVINNPINIQRILRMAREPLNDHESAWFKEGEIHFISVGRLTRAKNFSLLLSAFSRVLLKFPFVRLTIIGDGEDKNMIDRYINELNISDQVSLLGLKYNIFKYLSRADCFVISSRWEGFGNAIVEAMVCGKPVIATQCSGTLDVLQDNRGRTYGVLVPSDNPVTLAREMMRMAEDLQLRNKYAGFSLERSKCFDAELISAKYIKVINSII